MTPYELGFEDCIHALCGDIEAIAYPFPYPSKELEDYDYGWGLCNAIHGPIYVAGHKNDSLAWAKGYREWGEHNHKYLIPDHPLYHSSEFAK